MPQIVRGIRSFAPALRRIDLLTPVVRIQSCPRPPPQHSLSEGSKTNWRPTPCKRRLSRSAHPSPSSPRCFALVLDQLPTSGATSLAAPRSRQTTHPAVGPPRRQSRRLGDPARERAGRPRRSPPRGTKDVEMMGHTASEYGQPRDQRGDWLASDVCPDTSSTTVNVAYARERGLFFPRHDSSSTHSACRFDLP